MSPWIRNINTDLRRLTCDSDRVTPAPPLTPQMSFIFGDKLKRQGGFPSKNTVTLCLIHPRQGKGNKTHFIDKFTITKTNYPEVLNRPP